MLLKLFEIGESHFCQVLVEGRMDRRRDERVKEKIESEYLFGSFDSRLGGRFSFLDANGLGPSPYMVIIRMRGGLQ